MADIRINALATTAASTASDDFVAVDGSANGTRKLNAYSPTFGGNLTVSGTGKVGGGSNDVIKLEADTAGNGGYVQGRNAADTDYTPLILIGNGLTLKRRSGVNSSANALAIDTSGNTTLSGNLTVSGTGTSSFGSGVNLLSIVPSTGICAFYSTQATPSFVIGNTSAINKYGQIQWIDSVSQLSIGTQSQYGTGALNIATNGNVLIGTTTDGGQKLQVNGTAYVSGDLTVGTKTGAQSTPDKLQMSSGYPNTSTPTNQQLKISLGYVSATQNYGFTTDSLARIWYHAGDTVGPTGGHVFATGGIAALTLDSSQNAIFAGSTGVQLKNDSFLYFGSTVRTAVKGNSTGSLELYANNNLSLTLDSSQNATFAGNVTVAASKVFTHNGQNGYSLALSTTADRAFKFEGSASGNDYTTSFTNAGAGKHNLSCSGAIAIGNTVNTVSPTSPNRTITMVIGGTTYYIHAKTTND